jgi:hypothetical protein
MKVPSAAWCPQETIKPDGCVLLLQPGDQEKVSSQKEAFRLGSGLQC